jgi:tripartite-type tricarboxylate transporter receptor subunit TctC
LTAQGLTERWGQNVIVDNRAGAGGTIGADVVAKAPPDGYTVLFASGSVLTVNQHLYKDLAHDPLRDLPGVINVAIGPMVVVVGAGSRLTSVADLIAQAKAAPGKLTFGSAGVGSQVHLAAEKLAYAAGIETVHIPYKGEAAAIVDIIAGQIGWGAPNLGASIQFIRDGKLRALAVTSRARSPALPETPTVAEAGLPRAENEGWFGIAVPANVPPAVVEKIRADTARVIAQSVFRERLTSLGMAPVGNTTAEFRAAVRTESASWARIIAERKISIQ